MIFSIKIGGKGPGTKARKRAGIGHDSDGLVDSWSDVWLNDCGVEHADLGGVVFFLAGLAFIRLEFCELVALLGRNAGGSQDQRNTGRRDHGLQERGRGTAFSWRVNWYGRN